MQKHCSISGCNKKVSARSWCAAHYSKWQRHGDPLYIRQFKSELKCVVAECERKQHSNGYCNTHYVKLRRSGTLNPIRETKEYKERWLDSRLTPISKIDKIRDTDPNRRGFLAVRLLNQIKQKARKRGIDWHLEQIDAYNLIKSPCYYCGFKPNWPESRSGLDRVNNFIGYKKENVVPCCYSCNTAKGTKTQAEFLEWVIKIFNHFPK